MGEVARTLVALSGPSAVHGIIPHALVSYERVAGPSDAVAQFAEDGLWRIGDGDEGKKDGGDGNGQRDRDGEGGSERNGNGNGDGANGRNNYGKTTIVPDMHTRKKMMAQAVMAGGPGSGFVALSGGYGTLEELMEVVTWNQLGIHDKGIVVLNVAGFWDGLLRWVREATEAGFVKGGNADIMLEATSAEEAVGMLRDYTVSEGRFGLDWGKS